MVRGSERKITSDNDQIQMCRSTRIEKFPVRLPCNKKRNRNVLLLDGEECDIFVPWSGRRKDENVCIYKSLHKITTLPWLINPNHCQYTFLIFFFFKQILNYTINGDQLQPRTCVICRWHGLKQLLTDKKKNEICDVSCGQDKFLW